MIFPILILGSLLAIVSIARYGHSETKSGQMALPSVSQTQDTESAGKAKLRKLINRSPNLALLLNVVKHGKEAPQWLVNETMAEAYDNGSWKVIAWLQKKYGDPKIDTPLQRPEEDASTTVSGRSSPLDGVSNEEWGEFVERLRSDDEAFSTDRHVGQFHHSRDRLSQLGIEDVSDGEKQYNALVADLEDSRIKSEELVVRWLGQDVEIDGKKHTITMSGILGILKAAGPVNASGWLEKPGDRKSFPHTTQTFIRTNGVF